MAQAKFTTGLLFGHTKNAIEVQIWTAVAGYLAVAIAKKKLHIPASLTEIIRFLPQALFIKMPIYKAFDDLDSKNYNKNTNNVDNQLILL